MNSGSRFLGEYMNVWGKDVDPGGDQEVVAMFKIRCQGATNDPIR